MALTKAMGGALLDLAARGGSGVLDKRGVLVAAGERLEYHPVTWVRLVADGLVAGGVGRLSVTDHGRVSVRTLEAARGLRVPPHGIHAPVAAGRAPMLDEEAAA